MLWTCNEEDQDSVLRVSLDLEVDGKKKRGRPKKTWEKQVEEKTEKIGLKKKEYPELCLM